MKKSFFIVLLSAILLMASCSNGDSKNTSDSKSVITSTDTSISLSEDSSFSEEEINDPSKLEAELSLWCSYTSNPSKSYDLTFAYYDSLFTKSATIFNKKLALLSIGLTFAASNLRSSSKYYDDLGFSRPFFADEYYEGVKIGGIGYSFATKQVEDSNLVAVSVRGDNYGVQWADNFRVGEQGNHENFDACAQIVYLALEDYLTELNSALPIKLWLTGYSRGGAIANILASKIMTNPLGDVTKDSFSVYTFEAPRALMKENALPYDNVFNVVNGADVIAKFFPEKQNFYRCGKDIEIYKSNIDQIILNFDENAVFPTFNKVGSEYENDVELADYIVASFLSDGEEKDGRNWSIATRELYNANYADDIIYLLEITMETDHVDILDVIKEVSKISLSDFLNMLLDSSEFVSKMKKVFDNLGIAYEEERLDTALLHFYTFTRQPSIKSLIPVLFSKGCLERIVGMHFPATSYILLKVL